MADIEWNGEALLQLIDKGLKASVDAVALQVIAEALPDVPVDTGFLRNSGYVVGQNVNTYSDNGEKNEAPAAVGENEAVAGFSAEYALTIEINDPYLHPALERVQTQVPSILKQNIPLN